MTNSFQKLLPSADFLDEPDDESFTGIYELFSSRLVAFLPGPQL